MTNKRVFPGKKKRVTSVKAMYRKWAEWAPGDYIIGVYRGSTTDKYKKPNWLVEVQDAQFKKQKDAERLIDQVIGLNSSGKLDGGMKHVQEGDQIQVTYNGKSRIESGPYKGEDAHDIDVDVLVPEDDASEQDDYESMDDDSYEDDDL